jgi:phosphate transport system substrate-binding protein
MRAALGASTSTNTGCEILLSKDAQDIIASPAMRQAGVRPLLPGEAAQELKKIE